MMNAMVLTAPGQTLQLRAVPRPEPVNEEILIQVEACGVCRTDLHLLDGELPHPRLPIIPGHEIVGRVVGSGPQAASFTTGDRVGVPWLGRTCGQCRFCRADHENLCDNALFTGYQLNGGYAEYAIADSRYCLPLPEAADAASLAPLLCAGLIGYRALRMTGDAQTVGLYGFGAAAHILAQILVQQGRSFHVFTRAGDRESQRFAISLGAAWAGSSDAPAGEPLDAAIIFAPAGELVPAALQQVRKGGTVVCAGIHMSDIPTFPYRLLWEERSLRSVANLTRDDGRELVRLLKTTQIRTHVTTYALHQANEALQALRDGRIQGAAVLVPGLRKGP